jgi:dTDP-4-dehydrorhamnose reductase
MTRFLLLGYTGQLGWELRRTLAPLGEILAFDYPDVDLTKEQSVRQLLRDIHPQIIVNATAYTAVDRAESEASLAFAVNADAPRILAEEAHASGAALIHYSTDYVFDGTKGSPYIESDAPNPLNVYGASKLAGERAITEIGGAFLILRTCWVYSLRRDSFVAKVLEWARQQRVLRVVDDQIGSPSWARMLAEITAQLLAKAGANPLPWLAERRGLYHLAGDGSCSRYAWAKAILASDPHPEEQIVQAIQPASTSEFPTPARRPLNTTLDCGCFTATFGLRLPPWEEALRMAME